MAGVVAILRTGSQLTLAAACGDTPEAVIAYVDGILAEQRGGALTGSGAPVGDVWLQTEQGALVRYSDIERLAPVPAF